MTKKKNVSEEQPVYNYHYNERGYFGFTTPVDISIPSFPPANATRAATPPQPWEGVWPRWTGSAWELEQDDFGKEYWPAGSDWETSSMIWNQRGPLPQGSLIERPAKPFELQQADKKFALQMLFSQAETSGKLLSKVGFEINATRSTSIYIQDLMDILDITGDETIEFRDYGNEMRQVNLPQLKTMKVEVMQYLQMLNRKKWDYSSAIDAATTTADLDAIVIEF